MVAAGASYMIWECYGPLKVPLQAMGSDFSRFRFLAPTAMAPTVQVCGKAVGERQERLNDQSCGHIPPQASQWAPIGHCYNIGWPWGAALRPSLHAPPAPSTWAPPRAPPWPTAGLRVLHDQFFFLRAFLTKQRFKSTLEAIATLSWCGEGLGGGPLKC